MPRINSRLPPICRITALFVSLVLVASAGLSGSTGRSSHSSAESKLPPDSGRVVANASRPDLQRASIPSSAINEPSVTAVKSTSAKMKEAYGFLPLSFEANAGQTDRRVKFLARGQGYGLFLTSNGAVLSLSKSSVRQVVGTPALAVEACETPLTDEYAVLSMELVGA